MMRFWFPVHVSTKRWSFHFQSIAWSHEVLFSNHGLRNEVLVSNVWLWPMGVWFPVHDSRNAEVLVSSPRCWGFGFQSMAHGILRFWFPVHDSRNAEGGFSFQFMAHEILSFWFPVHGLDPRGLGFQSIHFVGNADVSVSSPWLRKCWGFSFQSIIFFVKCWSFVLQSMAQKCWGCRGFGFQSMTHEVLVSRPWLTKCLGFGFQSMAWSHEVWFPDHDSRNA